MEFSTDREVILWKSITNGILIAQINIRLCCIDFHKGVNKGGCNMWIKCEEGADNLWN